MASNAAIAAPSVIRFVCFALFWILGLGGHAMYEAVKDLNALRIYDVIPGGQMFLSGMQMYATWGIFAIVWNFLALQLLGVAFSRWGEDYWEHYDWWLCLPGVVDCMVAISLIVSAVKQAQFLPRASSLCNDATNWGNGTDGRNFFLTANETTFSTYGGPEKLCRSMVDLWAYTVSTAVLYSLIALINILVGSAEAYKDFAQPNRSGREIYNSIVRRELYWAGLRRRSAWVLTPALWILDHPLGACWFALRYMRKARAARSIDRRDGKSSRHRKQRPGKDFAENWSGRAGTDAANQYPALPDELLLQVAGYLHFADLISAARSSKRLRISLFGAGGPNPSRLQDLRRITCRGKPKRNCELCGMLTCLDCRKLKNVPPSLASKHLEGCQPWCSKCFYKTYCRWHGSHGHRRPKHSGSCELREEKRTNVEMAVTTGRIPGTRTVTLCRLCASMTPAERMKAFEEKDERELDRMERHPLACSKCKEMLSARAMRWWICGKCLTECPSHMHPPWAERSLP